MAVHFSFCKGPSLPNQGVSIPFCIPFKPMSVAVELLKNSKELLLIIFFSWKEQRHLVFLCRSLSYITLARVILILYSSLGSVNVTLPYGIIRYRMETVWYFFHSIIKSSTNAVENTCTRGMCFLHNILKYKLHILFIMFQGIKWWKILVYSSLKIVQPDSTWRPSGGEDQVWWGNSLSVSLYERLPVNPHSFHTDFLWGQSKDPEKLVVSRTGS